MRVGGRMVVLMHGSTSVALDDPHARRAHAGYTITMLLDRTAQRAIMTQPIPAMEAAMAVGQFLLARAHAVDPACFAAVMATGIVSIDASQHGMHGLARALFVLNFAIFFWLLALSVLRLLRFRHELIADFIDPTAGAGFLTFPAGICVLA